MIHSTETASPFVATNGDATTDIVARPHSNGHPSDQLPAATSSSSPKDMLSRLCAWLVEACTVIGRWLAGRASLLLAAATTYVFFHPMLRNRAENAGILYTGDVLGLYWPAMRKTYSLLSKWNFTALDFSTYNGSSDYFLSPNFFILHPAIVLYSFLMPAGEDLFRSLGYFLVVVMALHSACACYFSQRLLTKYYGLPFAPAAFVATAFTFGVNMIASLGQPQFLFCLSIMPCVAYAALAFAERPSWYSLLLASLPALFGFLGGYVPLSLTSICLAVLLVVLPLFMLRDEEAPLASSLRTFLLAMLPIGVAAVVVAPYYLAVYGYLMGSISANTASLFYSAHQLAQAPESILAHLASHFQPPGPFAEFTFKAGFIAIAIAALFLFSNNCKHSLSSRDWRLLQVCAALYFVVLLATFGNVSPVSDLFYYFVPQVGGMHIYQRFLLPMHFFQSLAVVLMLRAVIAARPPLAIKVAFGIVAIGVLVLAQLLAREPATALGYGFNTYVLYELILCGLFLLTLFAPSQGFIYGCVIVLSLLPSLDRIYDYAHSSNTLASQKALEPMALDREWQGKLLSFIDTLVAKRGNPKEVVKYVDLTRLWDSRGLETFPKSFPYLVLDSHKLCSYHGFDFRMGPTAAYLDKMPMAVRDGTWVLNPNWETVAAANADFVITYASDLQSGMLRSICGDVYARDTLPLPNGVVAVPLPQRLAAADGQPLTIDNGVFQLAPTAAIATLENVARSRPATLSSTFGGRDARLAVDGDSNGDLAHNSIAHTGNDPDAWLDIDLGESRRLGEVHIWGVKGFESRLSSCWVFLSDEPFAAEDTVAILKRRPGTWSTSREEHESSRILVGGATGRYLRLQLDGTAKPQDAYLHVAEVEALAYPADTITGTVASPRVLNYSSNDANSLRLEWECDEPSTATYLFSDNRRLRYYLDGHPAPGIMRQGLLTFDVAPGKHTLEIRYQHRMLIAFWILLGLYTASCIMALLGILARKLYSPQEAATP